MSRCQTCRHWRPYQRHDEYNLRPSGCGEDDYEYDLHTGDLAEEYAHHGPWGVCIRQDDPGAKMWTRDASDYRSWLITQADFGCVQWEPTP